MCQGDKYERQRCQIRMSGLLENNVSKLDGGSRQYDRSRKVVSESRIWRRDQSDNGSA